MAISGAAIPRSTTVDDNAPLLRALGSVVRPPTVSGSAHYLQPAGSSSTMDRAERNNDVVSRDSTNLGNEAVPNYASRNDVISRDNALVSTPRPLQNHVVLGGQRGSAPLSAQELDRLRTFPFNRLHPIIPERR
jgi:hypothetical protein